jgi:nucleotide-binding universal stress UspA family protein
MKTFLVPIDFSSNSLKALKFAISTAIAAKGKVVVIHQMSILELAPENAFTGLYVPPITDQVGYALGELQKFIKKAVATFSKKVDEKIINSEVIPGVGTVDIILESATRLKADAIILGTTGASGLKRLFIGSIAAQVVEKAKIPVIVIPNNFRQKSIKKIGYASDLAYVQDELKKLAPLAEILDAKIELFHVEPTFPTSEAFKKFDVAKQIPELAKKLNLKSLTYKLVKTKYDNDFYSGVEKYRNSVKPDMICMVTHKRSWVSKLIEPSKSKGLAYHTKIPVICIK